MTVPTATVDAPRVVVYGEYPPFTTPGAAAALDTVRSLLADGREIGVVSPRPSAAHHHADVGTVQGALKLIRIVPGAELIVWLDGASLGRLMTAAGVAVQTAFGMALRRARSSTIHLSPLPGPPTPVFVRAVLTGATHVRAASQGDAELLRAAGLDGARLSISGEAWWQGPVGPDVVAAENTPDAAQAEPWSIEAGASRGDIEAEVRRRAVEHRDLESAAPLAAAWPLHMLSPLAPAATDSAQPLFRWVKRAVHRLVAWEVVPIVEQLNHLQRATIESFDRQAVPRDEPQRAADITS